MEEQPRKLESLIHVLQACLNPPDKDANKEANKDAAKETNKNNAELVQDLVFNENILLQTLGFDVAVDHPHTHVIKTCQLVKGKLLLTVYNVIARVHSEHNSITNDSIYRNLMNMHFSFHLCSV